MYDRMPNNEKDVHGNQYLTQEWIVFGLSESTRLCEKVDLMAMKNEQAIWTPPQFF
jgi:hypothetical protein